MKMNAERLVEVWRGDFCESIHNGHVAVWHADAGLIWGLGDVAGAILPRSSSKMVQALPLIESGAADAYGLSDAHLALACASHQGAAVHTEMVTRWLADLDLSEADLRCGVQWPNDTPARDELICTHCGPDQRHNNCSGKHSGFLTLTKHLKAGPEYIDPDHPIQRAIKSAWEDVTDAVTPGYGIDGCSAPNFALSLSGLARAMASFAAARDTGSVRERAMYRLTRAMAAHPELVAGQGRACTELMLAMDHRVTIKTGAEAVFVAIIPERKMGLALKIVDGAPRASEAALTAILCRLGVLDANHPAAQKRLPAPQVNWRGLMTGELRLSEGFV
jgi:L-asparaginase II